MNREHLRAATLAALTILAITVGCDPYDRYCAKVEACADEDEEGYEHIGFGSDFKAVCYQTMYGQERVLRANEEDECHKAADAYKALVGCMASVEDCQDLRKTDMDGECKDEREASEDTREDAEKECDVPAGLGCAAAGSSAPVVAALALALLALRRARARTRRAA